MVGGETQHNLDCNTSHQAACSLFDKHTWQLYPNESIAEGSDEACSAFSACEFQAHASNTRLLGHSAGRLYLEMLSNQP